MANRNRDDFSKSTIDVLGKRAGYLCSNPDCKIETMGAHEEKSKSTSIGIAAHIEAAATGGKRFRESMTKAEREDISNGIWLCAKCATLIDKDPDKFPILLLKEWKQKAEEESSKKLRGTFKISNLNPVLEADLTGRSRVRSNIGVSDKNPKEFHEGQWVIVMGNQPIIHWGLMWRYKLVIHNNSSYPAFAVKIESIGTVHFNEIEKLDKVNNIAPLGNIELKAIFEDYVEGYYIVPEAIMKSHYPEKFKDLILKITYMDENRIKLHCTIVTFNGDEIVNTKQP